MCQADREGGCGRGVEALPGSYRPGQAKVDKGWANSCSALPSPVAWAAHVHHKSTNLASPHGPDCGKGDLRASTLRVSCAGLCGVEAAGHVHICGEGPKTTQAVVCPGQLSFCPLKEVRAAQYPPVCLSPLCP